MPRRTSALFSRIADHTERRVQATVFLPRLAAVDGEWLAQVLPTLQRRARPEPQAVRIEDVSLRYRSGRLGIADALDATAALLSRSPRREPPSRSVASGTSVTKMMTTTSLFDTDRPATLDAAPQEDLLVSARVCVDAAADDPGAAALYWAVLALIND